MKFDDRYRSIFKTDLIEGAMLAGEFGFPVIHRTHTRPSRLISFDKAISCRDYSQWVHFYIPDPSSNAFGEAHGTIWGCSPSTMV